MIFFIRVGAPRRKFQGPSALNMFSFRVLLKLGGEAEPSFRKDDGRGSHRARARSTREFVADDGNPGDERQFGERVFSAPQLCLRGIRKIPNIFLSVCLPTIMSLSPIWFQEGLAISLDPLVDFHTIIPSRKQPKSVLFTQGVEGDLNQMTH